MHFGAFNWGREKRGRKERTGDREIKRKKDERWRIVMEREMKRKTRKTERGQEKSKVDKRRYAVKEAGGRKL